MVLGVPFHVLRIFANAHGKFLFYLEVPDIRWKALRYVDTRK